ncbi:MAG: ribonuclease J [Candidatus Parcubacteria bacterium]|nr:ribonuclease J [Candidatus Parcubacteria bacterium]
MKRRPKTSVGEPMHREQPRRPEFPQQGNVSTNTRQNQQNRPAHRTPAVRRDTGTGTNRPTTGGDNFPKPKSRMNPGKGLRNPGKRPAPKESSITPSRMGGARIPDVKEGCIRIIPLGGVEEIGKNMTVFETKDDIFVVDIGLQFHDEETPGVDFILPNTRYLEERKDKIRGVFITHGHLDHIGGIPFIMPKIGNPPLYARNLTSVLIQKRQLEFPNFPTLDLRIVEKNERIKIGKHHIEFFAVSHSIPDAMGVIINTEHGDVVFTGDLRVDNDAGVPTEAEVEVFSRFKDRRPLLLLSDSTNADSPGFSLSEKVVLKNIEDIIRDTKGRLIIGTFASQLERIIRIIKLCEAFGKKIVIEGRSMKVNIEVAKEVGLLQINKDTIITSDQMEQYPANKIVAIVTGSQGEEFAALMRMSNKTHKHFKITKNDTVLLSSSIIPGNEMGVQKIKDNLSRQGAKIIHSKMSEVHASGHANGDEIGWLHRQIGEKFFIPIHGFHYKLRSNGDIAVAAGVQEQNVIIPDNGMIIEIERGEKIYSIKEKAASGLVLVDGFSIGDMQEVVMRDRQMLAQDGMFIIVAVIDLSTKKLKKSPDILSRGFVYLRESQDLLRQSRYIIKKTIEDSIESMNPINFDFVKATVTDSTARFLFQQTAKRPIILPVILGV